MEQMKCNQVAAHWWANQIRPNVPNPEVLRRFETSLSVLIGALLDASKSGFVSLYSDHTPNPSLGGVARICGIGEEVFPHNTSMMIKRDHVSIIDSNAHKETIFATRI